MVGLENTKEKEKSYFLVLIYAILFFPKNKHALLCTAHVL